MFFDFFFLSQFGQPREIYFVALLPFQWMFFVTYTRFVSALGEP